MLLDISTAVRHHSGDVVLGDLEISLERDGADDVQAMKYIEDAKNTWPIYIGSTSSTTISLMTRIIANTRQQAQMELSS